jgi:glycosyltransferase involved in cell wall biosynthesis
MTLEAKPRVSVHIITYNQLAFVSDALTSALEQDYDNLQVVVSDDGSTDGTQDVIRDFARRYSDRLCPVLSERNYGITENCNKALRACSGDFIAFQGGDDLLLPGKIRKQVAWFAEHPKHNISYHDADVFDSNSGHSLYRLSDLHPMLEGDAALVVREGTFFTGTSVMVRRSAVPRSGFDVSISMACDWLFFIECLANGGFIGPIQEVLARYRRHSGNVTLDRSRGRRDEWRTLEIVSERYPALRAAVLHRAADLKLLDAVRDLRSGHITQAVNGAIQSVKLTGLNWDSWRLILRVGAFRVRTFWRSTFRSRSGV